MLKLQGNLVMKKLIITVTVVSTLTACFQISESSSPDLTNEAAHAQSQVGSYQEMQEKEAEAAAIAHDRYDPDSIYKGAENVVIPPPQLKRKLLTSEALEVQFRPIDTSPNFNVIRQTVYDVTRLKVISEIEDVLDKVEVDNPNCKLIGVEPFTVKFPKETYYGDVFNLVLKGCSAQEIKEVYLYTTHGKLIYRAIVEE